jgi:DUF4097 and DUF4098 domain-containing protein YvlB
VKRIIVISLLTIALLFVLAGIGAVVFFTARGGGNFFKDGSQSSATLEESKTLKVDSAKPITLKVIDDAGSVTITGADVKAVEVKVVKTAYAPTQARADEQVKTIKYSIEQTGSTLTLKYDLPNTTVFDQNLKTVDFIVTVPNKTTADIHSSLGDVSVIGITGNTIVANDFGHVTVENVEGALSVSNNNGEVTATSIEAGSENIELDSEFGAVTLKNAHGKNVILTSNNGTVTLKEVRATGDITAKTDFGNTTLENSSSSSLRIESNNGAVSLTKLRASKEIKVEDEFGEIELDQAFAASYDLHANGGSITVDGAKGKLKANTEFGGIRIKNAEAVTLDLETTNGTVEFSGSLGTGPHTIHSEFGGVNLTLPADSNLSVDLKTEFGNISSDLPITVTLNGTSNSNGDQIVGTTNDGGEQLTVETNNGGIDIKILK